jgi:hypothetical protein
MQCRRLAQLLEFGSARLTSQNRADRMLHGEALLRARRTELDRLITELRDLAAGRDDIRVECDGTIAGSWFASPATADGHELIALGCRSCRGQLIGIYCCNGFGLVTSTARALDWGSSCDG